MVLLAIDRHRGTSSQWLLTLFAARLASIAQKAAIYLEIVSIDRTFTTAASEALAVKNLISNFHRRAIYSLMTP
jgi:hypothetical protein